MISLLVFCHGLICFFYFFYSGVLFWWLVPCCFFVYWCVAYFIWEVGCIFQGGISGTYVLFSGCIFGHSRIVTVSFSSPSDGFGIHIQVHVPLLCCDGCDSYYVLGVLFQFFFAIVF